MVSMYTIRNIANGQIFVAPDFNLWQELKNRPPKENESSGDNV